MDEINTFSKVTKLIRDEIKNGNIPEIEGKVVEDKDGEIFAFKSGIVYVRENGRWFCRKYRAQIELFKDKEKGNTLAVMEYATKNGLALAFLMWKYESGMMDKCPIGYDAIAQLDIEPYEEYPIDKPKRFTSEEIDALMAFSAEQLEAIKTFNKAGKELEKNKILVLCDLENCTLELFNAVNARDGKIKERDLLNSDKPDESDIYDVTEHGREVGFPYSCYSYDGAWAILDAGTEKQNND